MIQGCFDPNALQVKGLKTKLEKKTNDLKQQSDEIIAVQTEMAVLREAKADAEASMQTYKEEMENLKTCCERDQREARLAMEKVLAFYTIYLCILELFIKCNIKKMQI